jgi:cytosine/uracil/thiamine/allantoin permease
MATIVIMCNSCIRHFINLFISDILSHGKYRQYSRPTIRTPDIIAAVNSTITTIESDESLLYSKLNILKRMKENIAQNNVPPIAIEMYHPENISKTTIDFIALT